MYHVSLDLQCIYECSEVGDNGYGDGGREWRLPALLYADDLVLCGESEEDLRKRRSLKVNAGKSKVKVLGGEEGLRCEVCVYGYV